MRSIGKGECQTLGCTSARYLQSESFFGSQRPSHFQNQANGAINYRHYLPTTTITMKFTIFATLIAGAAAFAPAAMKVRIEQMAQSRKRNRIAIGHHHRTLAGLILSHPPPHHKLDAI
jgi:hypothetical protein